MSNYVNLLDIVYPVGSVFISNNSVSPADSIGGTWTKLDSDTFICNGTPGATGGTNEKNFLSQIYHLIFGLSVVLVRIMDCLQVYLLHLIQEVRLVLTHRVLLIMQMNNILTSHLTTAPNIGLLTSISAQPRYILGGVA